MRVDINTPFRNDQTFYFLCKALMVHDELLSFINDDRDVIIAKAHKGDADIIVVYYNKIKIKMKEKIALFCFNKNDVPAGNDDECSIGAIN